MKKNRNEVTKVAEDEGLEVLISNPVLIILTFHTTTCHRKPSLVLYNMLYPAEYIYNPTKGIWTFLSHLMDILDARTEYFADYSLWLLTISLGM